MKAVNGGDSDSLFHNYNFDFEIVIYMHYDAYQE